MTAWIGDDRRVRVDFPVEYLTDNPDTFARQANAGGDVAAVARQIESLAEGETNSLLPWPDAPHVSAADEREARERAEKRGGKVENAVANLIRRRAILWIGACRVTNARNAKHLRKHLESVPRDKIPPRVVAKIDNKIAALSAMADGGSVPAMG